MRRDMNPVEIVNRESGVSAWLYVVSWIVFIQVRTNRFAICAMSSVGRLKTKQCTGPFPDVL